MAGGARGEGRACPQTRAPAHGRAQPGAASASSSGRGEPGAPSAPHGTAPEPILENEWQAAPGARGALPGR